AASMAQDPELVVRQWLQQEHVRLGVTEKDAALWTVSSSSTDKKGITYVYIQQIVNGIPVFNAVANFAVRYGAVVTFGDRLQRDLELRAPAPVPAITAIDAVEHAADRLGLQAENVQVLNELSPTDLELSPSGISHDPIPARLIYEPLKDGSLRLAWDLTIRSINAPNWWHIAIDAVNGQLLRSNDLIVHCKHPIEGSKPYNFLSDLAQPASPLASAPPPDGSNYRVFPFPIESPSHGPYTLVTDPADAVASPFGWHDTDGQPGAEYTITRGNNVLASEDLMNFDIPGYSPDGGTALSFDFPFAPQQEPVTYLDASITNLFYTCNVLHDVWYQYGFDQQSGNFQANNYGNVGDGFDEVIAEAQDGGGTNNANFGTPPDGSSGRMQMYLFRTSGDSTLYVNFPSSIEGYVTNVIAGFGPPLPMVPLTADLILVQDAVPPITDGCETIMDPDELAGNIALVDRGECTFISKVEALQDVGAVAVIVINNVPGDPIGMGGTGGENIFIPAVMISLADGDLIKQALVNGSVNVTLVGPLEEIFRDSDFDNGIIAHEYGHGVSNRLTGGSFDTDCLWNEEQMGEGWSDYMGMVLTMQPGDQGTTPRGVGTFVRDQETTGTGMRPAPYTTDLSLNGYTYGSTNDESLTDPHGIGLVWATMLWDLTWALIGQYGYDPDLYHGEGGNNIAIQLMMDGLKLQPCNPGFVDGRDAILMADELAFNGENECIIWNAFAQRGLGYSADQGSSFDRFDQLEAYDLPPACLNVEVSDRSELLE
ncbi:MAG: T9SS-dependent M36 family metallopeptidase, partial [Bacteroidota bacterium]|nr:T9SS-dependent M36 family metallopeptidase [Bacteroidota bacterium]